MVYQMAIHQLSLKDMETTRVNGSGGSLQLTWTPRRQASCGYVVDWYPVGRKKLCDIRWIKIPADQTTVTIKSGTSWHYIMSDTTRLFHFIQELEIKIIYVYCSTIMEERSCYFRRLKPIDIFKQLI